MEPLLTTEQVANVLGIKPQTLRKKRLSGFSPIPYRKIGRAVRYIKKDVENYLAAAQRAHT